MTQRTALAVLVMNLSCPAVLTANEKPYITTQSEITLLSANDGEMDIQWRKTAEGLIDYEVKTKDSFTVIRLGPDHPPICRTVYGTIPCTIIGTPTMAMSADGRFGLITNHGMRPAGWVPLRYPKGEPITNEDIEQGDLSKQELAPPLSNMLSMIDLASQDFPVVDRVLFDDDPTNVLAHPDGKHFVVGASENFYVFRIEKGRLIEVSRSPQDRGGLCFWINPAGNRIIATQGDALLADQPSRVHWYSLDTNRIRHLSEVKVAPGTDTELGPMSYITRISLDGRKALICQRAGGGGSDLCDVLVADLTATPPIINSVIKQVGDGVESFAFHPNRKMAVVTCLSLYHNSIAVLDIESEPPRLLYHLDVGGDAQGIEFTPEGDKLFVGSPFANRIEVFDVVGDFDLRKSQKFLKTGHGHCSLTLGKTYEQEAAARASRR